MEKEKEGKKKRKKNNQVFVLYKMVPMEKNFLHSPN